MSSLGIYDILVLVLIGVTAFVGWRKGLATQVASILSIGISYIVAVRFRGQLSGMINAVPPWDTIAAMLVLYLGTSFVIWLLFRQVRASLERMKLREFDHQMGFLLGALKGVVLAGIITMFAFALLGDQQRRAILESKSGYWIAKFMVNANTLMPPEVQQFVAQYLGPLEQGFEFEQIVDGMSPGLPTGNPGYQNPSYQNPSYQNPSGSTYGSQYGNQYGNSAPTYVPPNAASSSDYWNNGERR